MALVAPANSDPIQVPHPPPPSTMEPPRVERASELASEYSSLVSGAAAPDSPDQLSGSPSRQRELDLASAAAAIKSEEYRQLFRLPPGETLLQDFNCALQENILFQGHMYVFRSYLCFYSNIFGFETRKTISFKEITEIRRAKTAGIFPNAIEICTGERKHFFASFLSRDEAFKLINDLWPDHENSDKENSVKQGTPSESSVRNRGPLAIEDMGSVGNLADELDSVDSIPNAPNTSVSGGPSMDDDGSAPVSTSELPKNGEEPVQVPNAGSLSPVKSMKLKQQDAEAPKVPEDFVKVAEAKFPIKASDFFRYFFSDEGVTFVEAFRKSCGDTDFKCTSWRPIDKFGHVRELSFLHPIKIYLGAKSGSCRETQKVRSYRNSHLMVETSQSVNGVPYADYFTVKGIWDVKSDESDGSCILKVYLNVAFSQRTVWKGKIVQSTMEECHEAYALWIKIAHELLKMKHLEKQDEARIESLDKETPDHADRETQIKESSETVLRTQTNESMRQPLLSSIGANNHLESVTGRHSSGTTHIMSSFGGLCTKILSASRNQAYLPHMLVITVAVVLLMQLTIVLLLSRPPHVQPVYQMDYLDSMNQGFQPSPQQLAWLEKRVHHLNEEMIMVESQLERMRLEHRHLKRQLADFEHFSRKK